MFESNLFGKNDLTDHIISVLVVLITLRKNRSDFFFFSFCHKFFFHLVVDNIGT